MKHAPGLLALVLLASAVRADDKSPPAAKPTPEGVEFFEKKVRPVLVQHCYSCHSADAKKLKGELRLDTRAGVLKGGSSGPAIVPGDPEKSLLVRAVRHGDPATAMPPGKKLSAAEIADLEAWVKRGAPDPRGGKKAGRGRGPRSGRGGGGAPPPPRGGGSRPPGGGRPWGRQGGGGPRRCPRSRTRRGRGPRSTSSSWRSSKRRGCGPPRR